LILKPISPEYAEDIFREFDDNVTKYMSRGPNESLESTNEFVEKSLAGTKRGEKAQLVVTDRDGDFLGLTSVERANTKTPELGLWLKESAQGQGFGPELIFALYKWATENLDVDYFVYRADKENVGSWKIAEKLIAEYGGEYIGEIPEILRGRERLIKTYHLSPKT
jgi:RimJ/RimL family protein N-acetyltransferase